MTVSRTIASTSCGVTRPYHTAAPVGMFICDINVNASSASLAFPRISKLIGSEGGWTHDDVARELVLPDVRAEQYQRSPLLRRLLEFPVDGSLTLLVGRERYQGGVVFE